MLDSGSGTILIDREVADRMQLTIGTTAGSALGGGNGRQPFAPVRIHDVRFGPFRRSVDAFAIDLSGLSASAGFPIDALLGRPVFADRVVAVDYPARKVRVLPDSSRAQCQDPIPYDVRNGVPVVEATLYPTLTAPGIPLHLIVDLGTRHFAALIGGPFLETEVGEALMRDAPETAIATGTGGAVRGTTVDVAMLTIGSRRYRDVRIALTRQVPAFDAGFADGTLGVPLWQSRTIVFDDLHGTVCW